MGRSAVDSNEVFFDGVRIPADHLVGKRGEGWRVANVTLRHERNMLSDIRWLSELFESLVDLARRARAPGAVGTDEAEVVAEGVADTVIARSRRRFQ